MARRGEKKFSGLSEETVIEGTDIFAIEKASGKTKKITKNNLFSGCLDALEGDNEGDIIRWNAGTNAWEVIAEPFAFTQINLTPRAAAVANSEGGLYYDSGEKAVKVCVDE